MVVNYMQIFQDLISVSEHFIFQNLAEVDKHCNIFHSNQEQHNVENSNGLFV